MIARNQKSDIPIQSAGRTVLQRVADDFRLALTMAMQDLQRSLKELERKEESPQGTPPLSCQIPQDFPMSFVCWDWMACRVATFWKSSEPKAAVGQFS